MGRPGNSELRGGGSHETDIVAKLGLSSTGAGQRGNDARNHNLSGDRADSRGPYCQQSKKQTVESFRF